MKRNILVTGGNRGIGLAIVKGLALNREDTVLLGCRDIEGGRELATEIGVNLVAVEVNLSERAKLQFCVQKILNEFTRIDVLINNAAVLIEGDFESTSLEDLDQSLRVNAIAPLELIRMVVPGMKQNGYGRIVNISSGWGAFNEGLSGPFSYSFTKAALNALTLTVAKDLPPIIKVNSMCPGWVRTRMGGTTAPRSPEEGAETALWLTNLGEDGASGSFFRDKQLLEW